jgi:hypothetical protein
VSARTTFAVLRGLCNLCRALRAFTRRPTQRPVHRVATIASSASVLQLGRSPFALCSSLPVPRRPNPRPGVGMLRAAPLPTLTAWRFCAPVRSAHSTWSAGIECHA